MSNKVNNNANNYCKIIIAILVVLLIGALGFICYDKFINSEKQNSSNNTEIKYLKSLDLNDENQIIQIGEKSFKLRVEGRGEYEPGNLYINDALIKYNEESDGILAEMVYYTNEFAFFVIKGQSNKYGISYAIDKYGNSLSIKDDYYQMDDFKLTNGVINATGAECCDATGDSQIKTLSINYVNNSIVVKECENVSINNSLGEKVNNLKNITLATTNQTIKVGKKEYKVRKDSNNYLLVNDELARTFSGDEISVDHVYLTDKFLFVTVVGQFNEWIQYALDEEGEVIANNNGAQMRNFKIADGYLHAVGGVPEFNGYELDVVEHDLLIKYIDNTLIVVDAK